MSFKCGIVGLPNVGKSTLFQALTASKDAKVGNFPFCTIEPNKAVVAVPDDRLNTLAKIEESDQTIPIYLEFVDIAGLIKGSSQGAGLGNKFLSHIREVDIIIHVVRCFVDDDIIHVEDNIDPVRDIEIIETELLLADINNINNILGNLSKKKQSKDKAINQKINLLEELLVQLNNGVMAINYAEIDQLKEYNFLTSKPIIYVCNMDEDSISKGGNEYSKMVSDARIEKQIINLCANLEAEISQFTSSEDCMNMLQSFNLDKSGLDKVIWSSYNTLDVVTFFTAGKKETRAWLVKSGSLAPEAAAVIHTDFGRGFISVEKISYQDFIDHNGYKLAKDNGKVSCEGKNYLVQDGDIMHFLFNV